jgi:hypothetical protein
MFVPKFSVFSLDVAYLVYLRGPLRKELYSSLSMKIAHKHRFGKLTVMRHYRKAQVFTQTD